MKNKYLAALAALIVSGCTLPAPALAGPVFTAAPAPVVGFFTGGDLLTNLTGSKEDRALAVFYILGAHDTVDGKLACTPDGINAAAIVDVVQSFLAAVPEAGNQPAGAIIALVLRRVWPCMGTPV